ncbi:ArsR/SmtB family transcription factor [Comamonas sp. GB3 AK4-5]|uniref:ArsR/SmtB family transcription factor n=1 Tax=Comamonas sp. GB3 AK4-5 TaxID=3231487 RepID=UPI00351E4E4C
MAPFFARTLAAMDAQALAQVAALIGEPARAAMLWALMDGRALTARELAQAGGIQPATASRHLALMVAARLLQVQPQGRHRYHRLASAEVAQLLEGLMRVAGPGSSLDRPKVGPQDAALRTARTCYDHLAGRLGVAIAEHLLAQGALAWGEDGRSARLLAPAAAELARWGVEGELLARAMAVPKASGRPLCRPCLDWSERRPHLAGVLGACMCQHGLERGWLLRRQGTRALAISPAGAVALRDWLGLQRWQEVVGD